MSIANALVTQCPDIAEATCVLVSRIGQPVDRPQAMELQLQPRRGITLDSLRDPAIAIARDGLHRIAGLSQTLIERASIEAPAVWPGVHLF